MTTTVQKNNIPEERLIKLEKEVEGLKKILHTLFGKTRKKVKVDETEIFRQQMNRLISNHNKKTIKNARL
jgi:hypothetical protein